MTTIVALVCSIVQGAGCKHIELTLEPPPSPFICMFAGQTELAKWTNEHPNFSIQGYTCGPRTING